MPAAVIDRMIVALEEHEAKTAKLKELLRDPVLAEIASRVLSNLQSPKGNLAGGQVPHPVFHYGLRIEGDGTRRASCGTRFAVLVPGCRTGSRQSMYSRT